MHIKFKKIIIHNFLSFGDAELYLADKGYCAVRGVNKNPKDAALSNGSGKSSLISAICWVLTGETIQGISKNIVNINLNDGCWVNLIFSIDNKEYSITRYKDFNPFGSDLKIIIDGEDKSGKGIRESESLLKQYLPDLSSELLGNVILLGQGLPHKFADNTPSDRKKLLEKLSKSDFMIEDIKSRILKQEVQVTKNLRTVEDEELKYKTEKNLIEKSLEKAEKDLLNLSQHKNFDEELEKIKTKIITCSDDIEIIIKSIETATIAKDKTDKAYKDNLESFYMEKQEALDNFAECQKQYYEVSSEINQNIAVLKSEIDRIQSIKDVCPTCGQRLPDIQKPDCSEHILKLKQLQEKLNSVNTLYEQYKEENISIKNKLSEKLNVLEKPFKDKLDTLNKTLNTYNEQKVTLDSALLKLKSDSNKLQLEKESYEASRLKLVEERQVLEKQKIDIESSILYINKERENLEEHKAVLSKINTLIKRDFRGFLLSNIIHFIDKKAKDYAKDIFGDNPDFEFKLDGNNVDISYCKKPYENLSGGEKQKIDLIMQFAIRDMMSQYLDFSSNCLFLDEILDNLDMIGCTNVLNLVSHKLSDVESIFVISHHSDLDIPYDNSIIIEKDKNGVSRIK